MDKARFVGWAGSIRQRSADGAHPILAWQFIPKALSGPVAYEPGWRQKPRPFVPDRKQQQHMIFLQRAAKSTLLLPVPFRRALTAWAIFFVPSIERSLKTLGSRPVESRPRMWIAKFARFEI